MASDAVPSLPRRLSEYRGLTEEEQPPASINFRRSHSRRSRRRRRDCLADRTPHRRRRRCFPDSSRTSASRRCHSRCLLSSHPACTAVRRDRRSAQRRSCHCSRCRPDHRSILPHSDCRSAQWPSRSHRYCHCRHHRQRRGWAGAPRPPGCQCSKSRSARGTLRLGKRAPGSRCLKANWRSCSHPEGCRNTRHSRLTGSKPGCCRCSIARCRSPR